MSLLLAITGVLISAFGALGIRWRSRRQQSADVGQAFQQVVASLAAERRVDRLGAAILLRRFFTRDSEYAKPGMPYANAAIDVVSATLRSEPTGDVQKVLADGLAHVASFELRSKDFQRTNLTEGHVTLSGPVGDAAAERVRERRSRLSLRIADRLTNRRSPERVEAAFRLDLSRADFWQARLARASFRNNICRGTVFYEASAAGAVFRDCDLAGANFMNADLREARFDNAMFVSSVGDEEGASFDGADLRGARFDGADLRHVDFGSAALDGARFRDAKNVPPELETRLDDGIHPMRPIERTRRLVFLSAPSVAVPSGFDEVGAVCRALADAGVDIVRIDPASYEPDRPLEAVRASLEGCSGLVAVGLPQLAVDSGTWRPGTAAERPLAGRRLHTPWNDIEVGMAVGLQLPVLCVAAGCADLGVFGIDSQLPQFTSVRFHESSGAADLLEAVEEWVGKLGEPDS